MFLWTRKNQFYEIQSFYCCFYKIFGAALVCGLHFIVCSFIQVIILRIYRIYATKKLLANNIWEELWWVSSCSESFRLLVWQAENTTSGQGLSRARSPVGSRFSGLLLLDFPGTATEQVRTCGFRRNSSSLDKAPKMRDSVRINSWESFLLTLPSISSETWVMYSSAIPGLSVFCDWLFLVFSGVSLETAAKFPLFLNVAMILREKLCQLRRLNWLFNFVRTMSISSIVRGK